MVPMAPDVHSAPKEDLRALLARGIDLNVQRLAAKGTGPERRSAVLVLFGALDDVLAEPRSGAIEVVDPTHQPPGTPRVPGDLDVLLQRRSDGMRHHPGQIAFPGGGIDPGETAAEAAVREAHEETGLDPAGVEILGLLPEVSIPVSNNRVTPVVGWWSRPSEIAAVDHTEAVQVFRVPVAELLDPAARGTGLAVRPPYTFRSEAFELHPRFGGHIVWGFTGTVLSTLFAELGWAEEWDRSRELPVTLV